MCLALERQRRMRNNLFVLNRGLRFEEFICKCKPQVKSTTVASSCLDCWNSDLGDRMTGFQTPQPI